MRNIFLFLFILLEISKGFCQRGFDIDSLKRALRLDSPDTIKVTIMRYLIDEYRVNEPDSALFYGQRGLSLSRQIHYPKEESLILTSLGFVYDILANDSKAYELYLKGLKIADKYRIPESKAYAIERLGDNYRKQKQYAQAIAYCHEAKQLYEGVHDSFMVAIQLNNLGRIYLEMNQLDSAFHYADLLDESIRKDNLNNLRFLNYYGRVYAVQGNHELALHYTKIALNYALKYKNLFSCSGLYFRLSKIYKPFNRDSAIHYANLSLTLAQKGNFYPSTIDAAGLLAALLENNDKTLSIQYYKMAIAAKDSLTALQKHFALKAVTDFDAQERQYEIETATSEWHNRNRQYALLMGLGVVLLVSFILYRNNRQKHKANVVLEKTLSTLKATQTQLIQSEKLASLGELTAGIAHEIQNPLNFVNNFSELSVDLVKDLKEELKRPDKDETYIDELFDDLSHNQEKINHHGKRASSIVKGMLEHSRASTGVKELTDINQLADEYLRLAYHGLRAKDKSFNADFSTDFDENLPKIEVIPQDMGRVLLNLINNAFYAVHQRNLQGIQNLEGLESNYTPSIVVSTQQFDNQIIIKVKDNGIGMPESVKAKIFQPFFTTKPTGQGTGLGLSLAYDIVTKGHGGSLEVKSTEGVGSEFIITLPFKTNG